MSILLTRYKLDVLEIVQNLITCMQGSVAKRKNLREASALISRSKYIFREKAHEKMHSLPGNVFGKRLREASALFPVLLQKRVKCTCFAKEVHLLREDGFFLQQTPGQAIKSAVA